jgi:hypothetical protein
VQFESGPRSLRGTLADAPVVTVQHRLEIDAEQRLLSFLGQQVYYQGYMRRLIRLLAERIDKEGEIPDQLKSMRRERSGSPERKGKREWYK